MPCFHPMQAYQRSDGLVVFTERGNITRSLTLACGQCRGCRLERSRQWAVRCIHEASLSELNCFVTLTYDDAHLPANGSLHYPDFQNFMKRVRGRFAPVRVRFYMCGEYGDENKRPHYHAILFGLDFLDKYFWRNSATGFKLYRSPVLEELWPFGQCEIGSVTFESAAYCARYIMQKVNGDLAQSHYEGVDSDGVIVSRVPEFNRMSLKPGIGAGWLQRYFTDVFPAGRVVVNGVEANTPRYYDKMFRRGDIAGLSEDLDFKREMRGRSKFEDNTDERLAVKEKVAMAQIGMLKRTLN